ncbi:MAG: hypothetical protein HETSPECPRED_002104 [Heterodermia speciosa]|uniref:Uncharacterized protein n=1 Tax=Heterodermia speciosa TaxID=116794 RepID=A0A8H3J3M3_9LECA|nr:MAG: hypothetical protein HETSPECPRED_002104 [Heterodermia speciosa]
MTTFEQRLATFVNWPHRGTHAPGYMAAAGWLHDHQAQGHNDAAKCFSCALTLVGWETAQPPIREHLDRNPHCAWITSKTMNTQEKREDSFGNWPFDEHHRLSYLLVAAAGFFQSDPTTHTVTCYACQLTLGTQQLGPDPLATHIRLDSPFSPCPYLTKAAALAAENRALPPSPPPTPPQHPRLKHQCRVCHNRFPTWGGLGRHLADPKKAHSPKPRKVIGRRVLLPRRAAMPARRRVVTRRRVPDLASRITFVPDLASRITMPPEPEYKIEEV